jgi:hypothetical protein
VTPVETRNLKQSLPWIALVLAVLLIAWLLVDRRGGTTAAVSAVGEETAAVSALSKNVGDALSSVKAELQAKVENEASSKSRAVVSANSIPTEASSDTGVGDLSQNSREGLLLSTAAAPNSTDLKGKTSGLSEGETPVQLHAEESAESIMQPEQVQASEESIDKSPDAVADLYRQKPEAPPIVPEEKASREIKQRAEGRNDVSEEEVPIDIAQMLEMARTELGGSDTVEHPAPFLASLSQHTKDGIPTILYQQHEYSNRGRTVSVTINGKQLQQGAAVSGIRVQEILPNSVVLEYGGTVFRLRALNSWVNL